MGFTHHEKLGVVGKTTTGTPGTIKLLTAAGVPYYLWVDSTGDLRIHTAEPTTPDSDGSVVGGQS
jgi:hypothetical protein